MRRLLRGGHASGRSRMRGLDQLAPVARSISAGGRSIWAAADLWYTLSTLAGSSIGRTSAFGAGCWRFEPSPASPAPSPGRVGARLAAGFCRGPGFESGSTHHRDGGERGSRGETAGNARAPRTAEPPKPRPAGPRSRRRRDHDRRAGRTGPGTAPHRPHATATRETGRGTEGGGRGALAGRDKWRAPMRRRGWASIVGRKERGNRPLSLLPLRAQAMRALPRPVLWARESRAPWPVRSL